MKTQPLELLIVWCSLLHLSNLCLAVAAHGLGVATLPGGLAAATDEVVGTVSLDAESTGLASSGGETTSLSVFVSRLDNPVDAGIIADANVVRIDGDDLEVFKGGVFVNPVRVKHTQVHGMAPASLLGDRSQVARELKVVNTSIHGLSVHNTVRNGSLAATATNSDAIYAVALLGLVSQLVRLVRASGTAQLDDLLALTVLPGPVCVRRGIVRGC